MSVEVILEPAQGGIPCGRTGEVHYFVCIKGVPYTRGLVITNAYPLAKAEKIKAAVEASLREYGQPPPKKLKPAKKVRTRFERVRRC